jgi:hypothetical protein
MTKTLDARRPPFYDWPVISPPRTIAQDEDYDRRPPPPPTRPLSYEWILAQ